MKVCDYKYATQYILYVSGQPEW